MKTLKDYEYFRTDNGVLYCGDNMEILPLITEPIDLCFTDPPYGLTPEKWDFAETTIKIFKTLKMPIVFTSDLTLFLKLIKNECIDYKYEFIWNKKQPSNIAQCKKRPLKIHEYIFVCGNIEYTPITGNNTVKCFSEKKEKHKSQNELYKKLGNDYKKKRRIFKNNN